MACDRPPAAFGGSPPQRGRIKRSRCRSNLPREGETRARGSLSHHLELDFPNTPLREMRYTAMLHHERVKPPAQDYPPNECNMIEKNLRSEFTAQMETVLALGNRYFGMRG